jgi:hypothetical protein
MKKNDLFIRKGRFFILVVIVSLLVTTPVLAQSSLQEPEPTPTVTTAAQTDEDTYTFPDLGFGETRLIGPFDSTGIQVSFPEEWTFPNNGTLHLEYDIALYGEDYIEGQGLLGGVLDVYVNDTIVSSITLRNEGDFSQDITIPASALVSDRTDGRMSFTFDLISEESCTFDFDVNVIIRESSYLVLPHGLTTPVLDLTLLPRPFYQPSSLLERTALLVLPDDPSPAELQAGMDVAAGFGSLTGGNLLLDTVTFDGLTTAMRNSENLIFVGKPASISLIGSLDLPSAVSGGSFSLADEEDGILQMVISPWNSSRAVLLVSGNTDAGVIKAGQAIKSGTILTTSLNTVSEVQEYRTEASAPLLDTDRTFLELGYEDRNLRSTGTNYTYIDFYIPPGQTVSNEAYLDLHFNHSALLSYETSGLTVTLNGRVISSVSFSDETTQLSQVQMDLPPSAFIQGTNTLLIQVQLIPYDNCTDLTNFISTWATLFSDSSLHLPLVVDTSTIEGSLNLSSYPENLALGKAQGNVTFILPSSDPGSWKSAAAVAYEMGDQLDDSLTQIAIQFADALDETSLADNNVVLVGEPGQLDMIYNWGDILPAPFESGAVVPYDPASRIVYRVVEGVDVGYIELFISPWGTERMAMLVSGNTDAGVALAASALSGGDFRGSLAGNFAIVSSGQIISLDTRYPVSSDLLESQTGQAAEAAQTQAQVSQIQRENMLWMLPAVIVITLLTVGVILIKLLPALKKSKKDIEKE